QIDPRALPVLDRLAADLGTPTQAADRWRWTAEALQEHLGPDLRQLARALWTSCQEVHAVRDVDYRSVLAACTQALIVFPTVRTFVDPEGGEARDRDRQAVATAIQQARTRLEGEV